jgi:predicted alpha-1,2-mannosidase
MHELASRAPRVGSRATCGNRPLSEIASMTWMNVRLGVRTLCAVLTVAAAAPWCSAAEPGAVDSARPMIGTSAHGHVYPGATVPFGMVQLSPDTRLGTWDGCSGYHYSDPAILGFSHTHLSGTGCGDLGDIRVTPLAGSPSDWPKTDKDGYHLRFSHERETASPGYYRVQLDEQKILAELTATAHAGMHRYTFPAGKPGTLVIDLARGINSQPVEGSIVVESKQVISGYRRSKGWAADKTYYFVAELSQRVNTMLLLDGVPVPVRGKVCVNGKRAQLTVSFEQITQPLVMKIGLSAVSVEAARKNLAQEIPGWDFDGVVAAARKSWQDVLGRIDIETSDAATRETFYTSLYHASVAPTLFNDADGGYRGLDHQPHAAEGFQNYSTMSLWDTFRAEHPLLTIIQPQRVNDLINSMLAHYRQFGRHALPIWPLAGNETWCMIGNHAIPVIVEAYVKGFRGFDVEAAYQAMRDTLMQDRNLMDQYRTLGYVPSADRNQSVSRTLEYAYDDWCFGRMAELLGKKDDARRFLHRAANYRHVFDPAVGFMRGKLADGTWRSPFDPRELVWADFTEATSWNYTWFVPHDVPGLVGLMGSQQAFIDKLDKMFNEDSTLLAAVPDMTGLIGQYVHGNEPCHHVAYLYNDAGAPWKTQERIRQVMNVLYNNTVEGICGNDDCGQMSAWYVLSALGFYPVNPASGVYQLGSPLVNRAVIHLDPKYHAGRTFTIVAHHNSPKNLYIQSATLNGSRLDRCWFTHAELAAGGELVLEMGPAPNREAFLTGKAKPWATLFDGKTLHGWKVVDCEADVEDGAILLKAGNGMVQTERTYRDFVLEVDWKALKPDHWDSGVFFRCGDAPPQRHWPQLYQANLRKGIEGDVAELKTARSEGLTKAGQWNHFRLTVAGTTAHLEINGQSAWTAGGVDDVAGYIGLQAEIPGGGQFLFRNIRVQELER